MKRSGPLKRKTPLRSKRAKPRRNEGRITHARVKPKATSKTAEEAQHMGHVAEVGCLICARPAEVHHVMHAPGKQKRRDHRFVVPLCPDHHRGREGVHGLGSESRFKLRWGVDLVNWCMEAWDRRKEPEHPFWTDEVTRLRQVALDRLHLEKLGSGDTSWHNPRHQT